MIDFRGIDAGRPSSLSNETVRILFNQTPWGNILKDPPCECHTILQDKKRWGDADAIVFHIPQVRGFPPRKRDGQIWVALCVESAAHYPMLARRADLDGLFDLWMTYQHDADVWCPYLGPEHLAGFQSEALAKTEPSPAIALISSSHDRSGRVALLTELMRHMPIDSHGNGGRSTAASGKSEIQRSRRSRAVRKMSTRPRPYS